ncbi:MAG: NAD-dependent epimerase/dehydratase family protein [Elusimicrobia bacterium]|nr:NAD-dependent epimerase/dehydratase family protein [Candidatus Obscuribacterium magneticum]
MRILVTGGAGFIGSHVVDRFISAGHRVWVIDNESTGKREQVNKKANYKKLDICNRNGLRAFFKNKKFDVVNHHAAQMDVRRSVEDPQFDAKVNIFGLLNLLEECRSNKVKKIIFSSSGGTIYGECKKAARETDPEIPLSPYGISKLASEKYIKAYQSLYGLKFTIFRYSNVYGPRQDPHGEAGVVAIFANKLLNKEIPLIFGTGKQTRDFLFVSDVARANLLALKSGDNEIFNLGTGVETSVLGLLKTMAGISESKKAPKFKAARPGELMRSFVATSKARKKLNWKPQSGLIAGLGATLQYFKDRQSRGEKI